MIGVATDHPSRGFPMFERDSIFGNPACRDVDDQAEAPSAEGRESWVYRAGSPGASRAPLRGPRADARRGNPPSSRPSIARASGDRSSGVGSPQPQPPDRQTEKPRGPRDAPERPCERLCERFTVPAPLDPQQRPGRRACRRTPRPRRRRRAGTRPSAGRPSRSSSRRS